MKLIIFFAHIKILLIFYSVIIERLLLYNEHYNDEFKDIINRNLNTIKYLIILLQEIEIIIYVKKNIDDFFKLFETLKIEDYTLKDLKEDIFLYHININDYKLCVEIFDFFKNILINTKKLCDKIIIIKTEISNKIREFQNIVTFKKSSSSNSLDFYRKTLEILIINKYSKNINKQDTINEIIQNLISLKKRNKKKIIELKNIFNENNIYIFDIYIDEEYHNTNNKIDDIIKILKRENKDKLDKINEIIKSQYLKLSSNNIRKDDIINEIIFKLINISIYDKINKIKKIISNNYIKNSNSINEDKIILEILKKGTIKINDIKKITEIEKILNKNYKKKENKILTEDIINQIISIIILEIKNDNILIRNELHKIGIHVLDEYLIDNNIIINIDFINDNLMIYDIITLKKINKILSKIYIENDSDKEINNLEKYYKFINSWDNIYIYDIDKIFYMINETNEIKREMESTDLLNQDIKYLVSNNIKYYSYDIEDNINVQVNKFKILIEDNKNNLLKLNFKHIKNIMKIIELYYKIVSKKLTDKSIKEKIIEILKIYNLNEFEYLLKQFMIINEYYKYDYDIIKFNNNESYKIFLEKFYIYKNYIYVIKNLYEYLLTINDNFNLLYSIIERIKIRIELYKKIDSSLKEILFEKLNNINEKKQNGIKFNNYQDIDRYLNKLIDKYSK